MANLQLFKSMAGKLLTKADTVNEAGGTAYQFTAEHALAQYAITGALNGTYYASAETQLANVLALCEKVSPDMIAKIAIYSREKGYMKDMPALLVAILSAKAPEYLPLVFSRVINNGKMLRNFVQIVRSGAVGRKSLGTRPKKLVQNWLNTATEEMLLSAAIGNNPSLADVVKMVHPKPQEAWREAFFAWLIDKPYDKAVLPPLTQAFEQYKCGGAADRQNVPAVPFQMLTSLTLTAKDWADIALQGGWHMVRMNLNTFVRHGVLELPGMAGKIADKLKNADAVRKAKVFPYQLMTAYKSLSDNVPLEIRDALQDALEVALENVPSIDGRVVICPDISGSMQSAVTGYRQGATTVTTCVDVAALIAATYLRKQQGTQVLPFNHQVIDKPHLLLNSRDSVLTNAARLSAKCGGGTDCSAPIKWLNTNKVNAELVIMVSDNESWMNVDRYGNRATETLRQWELFKKNNPKAKLVCLDIQPYATTQAPDRDDILNIGGFSDNVFQTIADFSLSGSKSHYWLNEIEKVSLTQ